jgi:uncharacterized cupredoxin-like copper-binding protein
MATMTGYRNQKDLIMSEATRQTFLARIAVAISVFSLIAVAIIGANAGKADTRSTTSVAAGPVAVSLTEYKINPGAIVVPKGGSLQITNDGTMPHNLTIRSTDLKIADLAAGASTTLDVSSLSPGEYQVYCSVAGHEGSGMKATMTIGDGSAASMDMASMDHGSTTAPSTDVADMEPGSAAAEMMNKKMEEAMTGGVTKFLDIAKQYAAGSMKAGNQKIDPKIEADGTKHFYLTSEITDWEVSPGNVVKAWTYNGRVPGPWIRVEPGDKVKVTLRNELPISTDIHWHGIDVPNPMDGVAPITQDYIEPFKSFTYSFTAPNHPELGMYHAHMHGQEAIPNGLFAMFQVGDVPLPRGKTVGGVTIPQDLKVAQEIPMVLNDAGVIGLSLNGKAFPETQPIVANKGDWLLIHFYNEGLQGHPMHLHRQPQIVVAKDGYPVDSPYRMDTIWVAPGERYSVLVKAEDVGTWAFHCHIVTHAENDQGLAGMVTALIVK